MDELEEIIAASPDNFVIRNALIKCYEVVHEHNKIVCSVSGGGDSDVMLDMLLRCGAWGKVDFVFFNTGLEYQATLEHLKSLEDKYGITIERIRPSKSIPTCTKEYGIPFWSKYVSDMMRRLQMHNFKWEDKPFDVLCEEYPSCKSALRWWCNIHDGNTTQWSIERSPYLKEFLIENPPEFRISGVCCQHAKKNPIHSLIKRGGYDLSCVGIRKAEGGIRSMSYKSCFSEKAAVGTDVFRPVFWFRDSDKEEYCTHYGVAHSKCYTEYGLVRTGCVGCPFGKRISDEMSVLSQYEPKLYKVALAVFGKSYDYTQAYMDYRNKRKEECKIQNAKEKQ